MKNKHFQKEKICYQAGSVFWLTVYLNERESKKSNDGKSTKQLKNNH